MSLLSEDKTVVTHQHSSAFIDSYRLLKRNIDPKATVLDQKAGSLKTVRTKLSLWIESHYLCHNMREWRRQTSIDDVQACASDCPDPLQETGKFHAMSPLSDQPQTCSIMASVVGIFSIVVI